MSHAPNSFNTVPPILFTTSYYQVNTAFTGATLGDIFVRINFISTLNGGGGAEVDPFFQCWQNHNTGQVFDIGAISLSNLTFVSAGSNGSVDIINAVNKVSSSLSTLNNSTNVLISNVSNNLSSIINLNTLNNTGISSISNAISSSNALLGQVSSGIAGIGTPTAGNTYLSQISNTLGTAFATAQLNVEAIAINGNKTYSNVKSAVIVAQPVLLITTLNTSSVQINSVPYSINNPIVVPIPPNSKLNNNLVITNNNIPISIIYTT